MQWCNFNSLTILWNTSIFLELSKWNVKLFNICMGTYEKPNKQHVSQNRRLWYIKRSLRWSSALRGKICMLWEKVNEKWRISRLRTTPTLSPIQLTIEKSNFVSVHFLYFSIKLYIEWSIISNNFSVKITLRIWIFYVQIIYKNPPYEIVHFFFFGNEESST